MSSPLVTHAMLNLWCAPDQDFQHLIELSRLTPDSGVQYSLPLMWDTLLMPTDYGKRAYYHVYQIGQVPPALFDIMPDVNEWVSVDELNDQFNILIDCYLFSGAIIPRSYIWISVLRNKNVIVAIKQDFTIDYGTNKKNNYVGALINERFTLDNSQVVIRFYSNAWFTSPEFTSQAVSARKPIRYVNVKVNSINDYNNYLAQVNNVLAEFGNHGDGVYYCDGFVINRPQGYLNEYQGKHFAFMWDESFKFSKSFPVRYLPAYISESNLGIRNYILLCDTEYDVIDYYDDIDIYVVNTLTGKGVYFNRVAKKGMSMITHNTYAINADMVEDYIAAHEFLGTVDQCSIKIMVRQGGRKNGLINQKNRINEMYRLTHDQVLNTLVNTPSLVPEWRATNLEKSDYVKLMGIPYEQFTEKAVVNAYGYAAISQFFTNPLVKVTDGKFTAPYVSTIRDYDDDLPNRSVWCYNADGYLLGYFNDTNTNNEVYLPPQFKNAGIVECFNAVSDEDGYMCWGNLDVTSNDLDQYGFRCYVAPMYPNGVLGEWDDVTDSRFYTYTPRDKNKKATIKWNWGLLTQANLWPMVKCLKNIFVYRWRKKATDVYDGSIEIVPKAKYVWGNTVTYNRLDLKPGVVDVFANGLSLIEGVDYFMDWPTIVIVNKDINNAAVIDVIVRCYGFANPETNDCFKHNEVGFIKQGMASINGHYDVRKNRNVRTVYNNRLLLPNTLNTGEYLINGNFVDGRPYSISDYILPIENIMTDKSIKTYPLYKEMLDIDTRVGDYLTSCFPEPPAPHPVVITGRWAVISPVVSTLLYLFTHGLNINDVLIKNYTNVDLDKWFEQYKWLLKFDPAALKVDENYFRILPHPNSHVMTISQANYTALERIILMYLNSRVDLTNSVAIG